MAAPTCSFTVSWVSPMLSAPFVITPTYEFDPVTLQVVITIPSFTVTTDILKACYGLIAPGNCSFPSNLQGSTQTAITTMDFGSGPMPATLTMYPDGSMALGPNSSSFFYGSSISVASCILSYTATSAPMALNYGTTLLTFAGPELPAGVTSTVYYSTDGMNVVLCIPSLIFATNHTLSNALMSTTSLSNSSPNLVPAIAVSIPTLGQSYKSGAVTSATFAIDTSGFISYTVPGNLPINSHSTFGYSIAIYPV